MVCDPLFHTYSYLKIFPQKKKECKAAGLVLVPMVVEVFGRWGERSVEAMKLATKGCAHRASVFLLLELTCGGACRSRFSA